MKKIIAIVLSILMFVSVSTVNASAEVNTDVLKEDFFQYYAEKCPPDNVPNADVVILEFVEIDDIVIFKGLGWVDPGQAEYKKRFGDWYSVSMWGAEELSVMDVYVKADGKIYSLETAWEESIITDLTPLTKFETVNFYPIGDINGDKDVNIKDATSLQKYLANMDTELSIGNTYEDDVFDINSDGKVNIRDATAIQKYLAKMDY